MLTSKVSKVGKVLICGMKGVGKTTILQQLIYGNITLESEVYPTIEDIYVASIDTGRGPRETLRIFDTAGLQGNIQLPRHYLQFPDGYILVYDPSDASSLDMLADVKMDIDKNKDKKEISIVVLANMRSKGIMQQNKKNDSSSTSSPSSQQINKHIDQFETILNRANSWCVRERIKHYTVNAMERASLYEPFINLSIRLHPPQNKSAFPQLRQVMQKSQKNDI